ncbi:hypothetical protein D5018_08810 [Parashewanella curva]|uniref:Uncharacterized protein n=1 Tax=Parashewanella curva TaxID=2338552 RepID=A0A3L8PZZ1_9GAMM|nr:hypothetical protein [Parashewanella curva]RLV60108.1 hypothetical protein D5018_08810 [Parashewanella curva]
MTTVKSELHHKVYLQPNQEQGRMEKLTLTSRSEKKREGKCYDVSHKKADTKIVVHQAKKPISNPKKLVMAIGSTHDYARDEQGLKQILFNKKLESVIKVITELNPSSRGLNGVCFRIVLRKLELLKLTGEESASTRNWKVDLAKKKIGCHYLNLLSKEIDYYNEMCDVDLLGVNAEHFNTAFYYLFLVSDEKNYGSLFKKAQEIYCRFIRLNYQYLSFLLYFPRTRGGEFNYKSLRAVMSRFQPFYKYLYRDGLDLPGFQNIHRLVECYDNNTLFKASVQTGKIIVFLQDKDWVSFEQHCLKPEATTCEKKLLVQEITMLIINHSRIFNLSNVINLDSHIAVLEQLFLLYRQVPETVKSSEMLTKKMQLAISNEVITCILLLLLFPCDTSQEILMDSISKLDDDQFLMNAEAKMVIAKFLSNQVGELEICTNLYLSISQFYQAINQSEFEKAIKLATDSIRLNCRHKEGVCYHFFAKHIADIKDFVCDRIFKKIDDCFRARLPCFSEGKPDLIKAMQPYKYLILAVDSFASIYFVDGADRWLWIKSVTLSFYFINALDSLSPVNEQVLCLHMGILFNYCETIIDFDIIDIVLSLLIRFFSSVELSYKDENKIEIKQIVIFTNKLLKFERCRKISCLITKERKLKSLLDGFCRKHHIEIDRLVDVPFIEPDEIKDLKRAALEHHFSTTGAVHKKSIEIKLKKASSYLDSSNYLLASEEFEFLLKHIGEIQWNHGEETAQSFHILFMRFMNERVLPLKMSLKHSSFNKKKKTYVIGDAEKLKKEVQVYSACVRLIPDSYDPSLKDLQAQWNVALCKLWHDSFVKLAEDPLLIEQIRDVSRFYQLKPVLCFEPTKDKFYIWIDKLTSKIMNDEASVDVQDLFHINCWCVKIENQFSKKTDRMSRRHQLLISFIEAYNHLSLGHLSIELSSIKVLKSDEIENALSDDEDSFTSADEDFWFDAPSAMPTSIEVTLHSTVEENISYNNQLDKSEQAVEDIHIENTSTIQASPSIATEIECETDISDSTSLVGASAAMTSTHDGISTSCSPINTVEIISPNFDASIESDQQASTVSTETNKLTSETMLFEPSLTESDIKFDFNDTEEWPDLIAKGSGLAPKDRMPKPKTNEFHASGKLVSLETIKQQTPSTKRLPFPGSDVSQAKGEVALITNQPLALREFQSTPVILPTQAPPLITQQVQYYFTVLPQHLPLALPSNGASHIITAPYFQSVRQWAAPMIVPNSPSIYVTSGYGYEQFEEESLTSLSSLAEEKLSRLKELLGIFITPEFMITNMRLLVHDISCLISNICDDIHRLAMPSAKETLAKREFKIIPAQEIYMMILRLFRGMDDAIIFYLEEVASLHIRSSQFIQCHILIYLKIQFKFCADKGGRQFALQLR